MNSSRIKYASTPTYGMQKRGFAKKQGVPQQQPTPDFTLSPSAPELPQIPAGGVPYPYGAPLAGEQPRPGAYKGAAYPVGGPMPPYAANPYAYPAQPYAQPRPPAFQGTAYYQGAASGYGGYAPPSVYTQTANGFAPRGAESAAGMPAQPFMGAIPPQQQAAPLQAAPLQAAPLQAAPLQAGAQRPPRVKKRREPIDVNKLMMFCLFGLLPVMFVPCLFAPQTMNALRYAFLAACVAGLGIMWYIRMFTQSTRSTISIVYIALCVVVASMLLGGGADSTTTAADGGAVLGGGQQATMEPSQIGAQPAAYLEPTVQPSFGPPPIGSSDGEIRLSLFMDYWSVMNIESMVTLVQPSWASLQDSPSASLFTLLSNRTPEEFTLEGISGTDTDSSRTVTLSALINKNNGKESTRYRFQILMVKENGDWYVDPNSLATNDVVTENAAATETVGLSTPPPRETVTPEPDVNAKFYYNSSGGKYYHLNPECTKVNKKYYPLSSFLYGQIKEAPYKSLLPCMECIR